MYSSTPRWTDRKAAYNKGFGNKLAGSCQLRLLVSYGSSVHAGHYAFSFSFSFIKLFNLHRAAVPAEEFQIPVHRQARSLYEMQKRSVSQTDNKLRQKNKIAKMKKLFIIFSLVSFLSCSKNSKKENLTVDNIELIKQYRQSLSKDEDFINNFKIDKNLTGLQNDSLKKMDEQNFNLFLSEIKNAKSEKNLIESFRNYNIANPEIIVSLIKQKESALLRVKSKYPKLYLLSNKEFTQVFTYSYKEVANNPTMLMRRPGCSNSCCDGYVDAIGDCDTDFAIGTAGAILAGAVATIVTTPIGGAGAVTIGIGTAYALHERCSRTAARSYRVCQGYE